MGRRKLTKILLESGCDPAIKNKASRLFIILKLLSRSVPFIDFRSHHLLSSSQQQGETAMDIALRKDFKEVQEIIAAFPVARDWPIHRKVKADSSKAESSHESCGKMRKDSKKVIIRFESYFNVLSSDYLIVCTFGLRLKRSEINYSLCKSCSSFNMPMM